MDNSEKIYEEDEDWNMQELTEEMRKDLPVIIKCWGDEEEARFKRLQPGDEIRIKEGLYRVLCKPFLQFSEGRHWAVRAIKLRE